jgi:peptidoglycan/xylan/chitin deacetylase (PgdA/CDA1 family)
MLSSLKVSMIANGPLGRKRCRRLLTAFLMALVLVALWGKVVWPHRYVWPEVFGHAVFSVNTTAPVLALTFDDGPDPQYTPQILAILADRDIKATFFMVGQAIEAHPEVAHQVIDQGHEVANHTWSHHSLNFMGPGKIRQEIEATDHILRQLGYQQTLLFRAPFGHSLMFLPWVLNHMGRIHVFWNIDPQDWDATSPQQILTALTPQIQKGGIILLHDGDANPKGTGTKPRDPTVAALPSILDTYLAQGYHFVTLSEMLEMGTPVLQAN